MRGGSLGKFIMLSFDDNVDDIFFENSNSVRFHHCLFHTGRLRRCTIVLWLSANHPTTQTCQAR